MAWHKGGIFFPVSMFLAVFFILLSPDAHAAPLAGANANMDQVASSTAATYQDYATEANDVTTDDVKLCGNQIDEALYLGMNYVFDRIIVTYATACGAGHVGIWEYYNGSTWASLTVTDASSGFEEVAGTYNVDITVPTDWTAVDPDDGGGVTTSAYFVRFRTTTPLADQVVGGDQFSARVFNVKAAVEDELGTAITGLATGAFTITNGTTVTKFSFREIGAGAYELALDTVGGDVDFTYSVTKDGYATSTPAVTGALTTALTDLTTATSSLPFAYKITSIATEALSTDITASVSGLTVGDDTAESTCTLSSGAWYCPVVLANSDGTLVSTVTLDGYVQKNYDLVTGTTRTAHSDVQLADTVVGVQYANKVTVTTASAGNAFAGATVTTGNAYATSCTENGSTGIYYCATPVAHTGVVVKVVKTGFDTNTDTSFSSDRSAQTAAQVAATISDIAYSAIADLSTGTQGNNSMALSWTASADTGNFDAYEVYYGTVTGVTNSSGTLWDTNSDSSLTDVTAYASTVTGLSAGTKYYFVIYGIDLDGNRSVTSSEATESTISPGVSLVPVTGGGGSSVSSGPTTYQTYNQITNTTTTSQTSASRDAVDTTPGTEDSESAAQAGQSGITAIVSEGTMLAARVRDQVLAYAGKVRDAVKESSFDTNIVARVVSVAKAVTSQQRESIVTFVTYGTPTTDKLGAGERGGVVSSFESAYGRLPESEDDWQDVVKIANGRWPKQMNEERESAAVASFKAIYLRAPDRTNERDDAAMMMLAYGLRPQNRSLEKEQVAIGMYRSIYKRNPSSATSWDAIRAIAYSGAVR